MVTFLKMRTNVAFAALVSQVYLVYLAYATGTSSAPSFRGVIRDLEHGHESAKKICSVEYGDHSSSHTCVVDEDGTVRFAGPDGEMATLTLSESNVANVVNVRRVEDIGLDQLKGDARKAACKKCRQIGSENCGVLCTKKESKENTPPPGENPAKDPDKGKPNNGKPPASPFDPWKGFPDKNRKAPRPDYMQKFSAASWKDVADAMKECNPIKGCTIELTGREMRVLNTLDVTKPVYLFSKVQTVLDAEQCNCRIFTVENQDAQFVGITFANGNAISDARDCKKAGCMGGAMLFTGLAKSKFNRKSDGTMSKIENCTFLQNTAFGGGAIAITQSYVLFQVLNTKFVNNKASGIDNTKSKGGDEDAFLNSGGGAIGIIDAQVMRVYLCEFTGNYAAYGGAIRATQKGAGRRESIGTTRMQRVVHSKFEKNVAEYQGGAIAATGVILKTIYGSTFENNVVKLLPSGGSAIYYQGPNPPEFMLITSSHFEVCHASTGCATKDRRLDGGPPDGPPQPPNPPSPTNSLDTAVRFDSDGVFLINNTGLSQSDFGGLCGNPAVCPPGHTYNPKLDILTLLQDDQVLENEAQFENLTVASVREALFRKQQLLWQKAVCSVCPVNTYATRELELRADGDLNNVCLPCDDGTSTQGLVGQTMCIPCSSMYSFSKHCTTPWLGILLGILTIIIVGLLVLSLILVRRTFTNIVKDKDEKIVEKEVKLKEQGRALKKSGTENRRLKESWVIDETEIVYDKAIGQGTFAIVFKGLWTGEDVAIKELKKKSGQAGKGGTSSSLSTLEENEVKNMLLVRHPRIVRFHGAGVRHYGDHSKHFLVYEWMGGGSLRSKLAKRVPVNWHWKLRVALDIALGIRYLHKRQFVHRDIKTDNILLDDSDRAKVGDFGTGRAINMGVGAQNFGSSRGLNLIDQADMMTAKHGTILYMAPELLVAIVKKEKMVPMSFKTDIFAFGLVLWELMSEQIPWTELLERPRKPGETVMQMVVKECIKGNRPTIPNMRVMPPDNYVALINLCWAQKPSDRPSIGQAVRVLDALVNGPRHEMSSMSMSSASMGSEDAICIENGADTESVSAALNTLSESDNSTTVLIKNPMRSEKRFKQNDCILFQILRTYTHVLN